MRASFRRPIGPRLWPFFVLLLVSDPVAAHTLMLSLDAGSSKPVTVLSHKTQDRSPFTRFQVRWDADHMEWRSKILTGPPRIVLDFFASCPPFDSVACPAPGPGLAGIRVGHHPDRVRVVLDIRGRDIPYFTTCQSPGTMFFRVEPLPGKPLSGPGARFVPRIPERALPPEDRARMPVQTRPATDAPQGLKAQGKGLLKSQGTDPGGRPDPDRDLMHWEGDPDGQAGSAFGRVVRDCKRRDWQTAIHDLEGLLDLSPGDRLSEKAYFLLAECHKRLYAREPLSHASEIRAHYERAVNLYPQSPHVPEAFLSLGNLCFILHSKAEALGYYNLILKRYKDAPQALSALIQKAKIYRLKNQARGGVFHSERNR